MQNWFFVQSAEYGKYYIEVDINGYGTYNIWVGMLYSDGSVGNPVDELTTSNKSSARRKYNKFIQDAETDSYGWNYKVPDLSWNFDINTKLDSVQEYILSNPKNIKASSYIRKGNNMKKYVKASRIGKTKEVFVVQEYTGYGRNGWEDVCEYPDNSSESWKEAKQDVKDYKDNGYSARIIRRRVPNPDYVAPEVTSSKNVACASGYDLLQNIVEVTKGTWFAPMSDFSKIVYNADEIIPVIDFDACIEFGTFNGQELLIYDEVDGSRHIRYSCSMTTMFDELVLRDVWDSTGKVYECDWNAIWDELENSHSR